MCGNNFRWCMKNDQRLDCLCHTVLEGAWRDKPDTDGYENAISEFCWFAKQSPGIQEQLPKSLKHGGDTTPWTSMFMCCRVC